MQYSHRLAAHHGHLGLRFLSNRITQSFCFSFDGAKCQEHLLITDWIWLQSADEARCWAPERREVLPWIHYRWREGGLCDRRCPWLLISRPLRQTASTLWGASRQGWCPPNCAGNKKTRGPYKSQRRGTISEGGATHLISAAYYWVNLVSFPIPGFKHPYCLN